MSRPSSPGKCCWYQTFHSSNDKVISLSLRFSAFTWSAVATTSEIIRSISSDAARKLAWSPS
jgi:hypothetical protein